MVSSGHDFLHPLGRPSKLTNPGAQHPRRRHHRASSSVPDLTQAKRSLAHACVDAYLTSESTTWHISRAWTLYVFGRK